MFKMRVFQGKVIFFADFSTWNSSFSFGLRVCQLKYTFFDLRAPFRCNSVPIPNVILHLATYRYTRVELHKMDMLNIFKIEGTNATSKKLEIWKNSNTQGFITKSIFIRLNLPIFHDFEFKKFIFWGNWRSYGKNEQKWNFRA